MSIHISKCKYKSTNPHTYPCYLQKLDCNSYSCKGFMNITSRDYQGIILLSDYLMEKHRIELYFERNLKEMNSSCLFSLSTTRKFDFSLLVNALHEK